jgi:hypothetical protein
MIDNLINEVNRKGPGLVSVKAMDHYAIISHQRLK